MRTAGIVVIALLGAVVVVTSARAAPYAVNSTVDAADAAPGNGTCATASGACTLRAAIQEANAHAGADVVSLPSGLYLLTLNGAGEELAATGDLDVTDALEVNGMGADTTIIDGLRADRVFHSGNALTLRNVTVRNGLAMPGGGLYAIAGATTIEGCRFEDNLSTAGGAIAHGSPDLLTITGSTFEGNATSGSDGGAVAIAGPASLVVTDSTFARNVSSTGNGGAIANMATGTVTLTNATFSHNAATNAGGILSGGFASFSASGCTFDGNTAVSSGGGMIVDGPGPTTLANATITNNTAAAMAGALLGGDTVQVTGGEVSDNVGFSAFGGLFLDGQNGASIDGTVIRRNSGGSGPGGGLFAASTAGNVTVANVEASENSAGLGGGIYAAAGAGNVSLTAVRVLNNGGSSGPGGGIFVTATGELTIVDSTVSGNVTASLGGGLYAASTGPMAIQGSTLAENRAAGVTGQGGGAVLSSGVASTLTNTTVSGNVADVMGGALYTSGDLTIRNATLAGNDSPMGSALFNGGGTLTVVSTIVTGGVTGHCGGAPATSGGNNIDSDGSCAFAGSGDQIADPQLGPLADNGGPTPTHLPVVGSPAVDGGANAGCPATDQRGQTRPTDGNGDGTATCDVGAVEFLDLCPTDPAKVLPGICGCGVADTDQAQANGTADCLMNGELKARIARAKSIIAALAGDQDPTEAELATIGASLEEYLKQHHGQVTMNGPEKKVMKLARKAAKAIKKVTKAKAGKKLDKAKTKANKALDAFDTAIAPQA